MLKFENLGHSDEAECLEAVTLFAGIADPDMRQKVINVMRELAAGTGDSVSYDEITFQ